MRVPRLYHALRARLAWFADRLGEWCDRETVEAYRIRTPGVQQLARRSFQAIGSAAHLVKLLPRLEAFRLGGTRWNAVCVGDDVLTNELEQLLFPEGASRQLLERVPPWRLRRFVQRYLSGSDLVVCCLPRVWPRCWRPRAPVLFDCPVFASAVLDVSRPLTDLLSGRSRKGLRTDFNKGRREGTTWRLSDRREDLECFYEEMYCPHVKRRHGSRALVSPLDEHWRNWIARGGHLLLLEKESRPVAGVTVRAVGSTYFLGEEGVARALEEAGFGEGLQIALKGAAIEHARSLGLKRLVMGRSLARLSDPGLAYKLRWAPTLMSSERCLHPEWTFLGSSVEEPLRGYINRQGLITFAEGRPCVVTVGAPTEQARHAAAKVGRMLVVEAGVPSQIVEVHSYVES